MKKYSVESSESMIGLGVELGRNLAAGAVIALVGDLGAGKTHFTKGVCQALGAEEATSPTYTLVNEILDGKLPLYHFDFYRVKQVEELYDLGWDGYLEKCGVVVAEWADLYAELIPENALWIKIEHVADGRAVTVA